MKMANILKIVAVIFGGCHKNDSLDVRVDEK
jgi:hypothetical protein